MRKEFNNSKNRNQLSKTEANSIIQKQFISIHHSISSKIRLWKILTKFYWQKMNLN